MIAQFPMTPEVVYEDRDLLVVNKPAGLQVHAARVAKTRLKQQPHEATLADWLLARFPQIRGVGEDPALRPGIVHRLDKGTSGIMMVAKNQKTFNRLKSLFQKHEVSKKYLAIVVGTPKPGEGTIDAPIGIRSGTLKRSVRSAKMAKPAVTDYRVVRSFMRDGQAFSLLEVSPHTGRTHQIRVHLASVGHPVVGDRLYGPHAQPAWAERLMLHALSLELAASDGQRMRFEAEPPESFLSVIHR